MIPKVEIIFLMVKEIIFTFGIMAIHPGHCEL
jgi:hypothetical protein